VPNLVVLGQTVQASVEDPKDFGNVAPLYIRGISDPRGNTPLPPCVNHAEFGCCRSSV